MALALLDASQRGQDREETLSSPQGIADGVLVSLRRASILSTVAAQRAEALHARRKLQLGFSVAGGVLGLAGMAVALAGAQGLLPNAVDWLRWIAFPALAAAAIPTIVLGRSVWPGNGSDYTMMRAAALRAATTAVFAGRFAEALATAETDDRPNKPLIALRLLAESLAREIESGQLDAVARDASTGVRRHARIVPRNRKVVITTSDGRRLIGNIANMSISGVALSEPLPRMVIGDKVKAGQQPAVVVRQWERGIAFRFVTNLDEATFGEHTEL